MNTTDDTTTSTTTTTSGTENRSALLVGVLAAAVPVLEQLPLGELPLIACIRADRPLLDEWGHHGMVSLQLSPDMTGRGTVAQVVRTIDAVRAWAEVLPGGVMVTDLDFRDEPSGRITARGTVGGVAVEAWTSIPMGPELRQAVLDAVGPHDPYRGVMGDIEAGGRAVTDWADRHRTHGLGGRGQAGGAW